MSDKCITGSNRQSEHIKPTYYKQRRVGRTWYVYWRCVYCTHTWITDGGNAEAPDYKKE